MTERNDVCIGFRVVRVAFLMSLISLSGMALCGDNGDDDAAKLVKLEKKLATATKEGNEGEIKKFNGRIKELKSKMAGESAKLEEEPADFNMPKAYNKIANTVSLGSSQPTKKMLENIMEINRIRPARFIVVDLRGEPHVFINGKSYYLEPLPFETADALLAYEDQLVADINAGKEVEVKELSRSKVGKEKIISYKPTSIPAGSSATTEQAIAKELGITYIRIPNDDHECPDMDSAYAFIKKVAGLARNLGNTFLIHCHGGQGRTTFYAILLDMLVNVKNDHSLEAIVKRQAQSFSAAILKGKEQSLQKNALLNDLYNYIRDNQDNFATPPPPSAAQMCDLEVF